MTGKFFIDSFTTLTPLSEFTEVNPELTDIHQVINVATAEIKETLTLPIFVTDVIGTKFRVSVIPLFGSRYLRITWTTKMLGANYFDGLNVGNFTGVFYSLMHRISCSIPYDNFLQTSKINDIDITCDFMASQSEFEGICSQYKNVSGTKRYFLLAENYLSSKPLSGMQFVNRKDASVSTPFIKFYTKKNELLDRSEKFYKYLISQEVQVSENLRRLEGTLKNLKHIENVFKFCRISVDKINILNVLSLSPDALANILNHLLSRYIGFEPAENEEGYIAPRTTPTNHLMSAMASELIEQGWSVKTILGLLDTLPSLSDTAKTRIKKRLGKQLREYRKSQKLKNLRLTAKDAFLDRGKIPLQEFPPNTEN